MNKKDKALATIKIDQQSNSYSDENEEDMVEYLENKKPFL